MRINQRLVLALTWAPGSLVGFTTEQVGQEELLRPWWAARSQRCPLEWSLEPISQRRKPSGEARACRAGPVRTGATPSCPGRPGHGLGCGLTGLCGAL